MGEGIIKNFRILKFIEKYPIWKVSYPLTINTKAIK